MNILALAFTVANKVFIGASGFIFNVYIGNQTYETVKRVADETVKIALELKKQNKPVKILVDLRQIGNTNAASRKASYEALQLLVYDRIALFGANIFLKHVANFIIAASGRGKKVRYFDTEDEGKIWLSKTKP